MGKKEKLARQGKGAKEMGLWLGLLKGLNHKRVEGMARGKE